MNSDFNFLNDFKHVDEKRDDQILISSEFITSSKHLVKFSARDFHTSAGGTLKSQCFILVNGKHMGSDVIAIRYTRRNERNPIINDAIKRISVESEILKQSYADQLAHHFLLFCMTVHDRYQRQLDTQMQPVAGDATSTPVQWLARPSFVNGGTIVFAPPGRGKSYISLVAAVSIDAGLQNIWEIDQPHRTAYVNLERSRQSLASRLGAVNTALGLRSDRPLIMLNARGRMLADLAPTIRRAISEHGIKLIILDSISRATTGNLNDNSPANSVIDILNSLGCAYIAIGHTSKASEDRIFGSIHWEAGADVVLKLTTDRNEDTGRLAVGMKITKANDIAPSKKLDVVTLDFNKNGLTTIAKGTARDFPKLLGTQSLEDEVFDLLLDMGKMNASQLTQQIVDTDPSRRPEYLRPEISRILQNPDKFVRLPKEGKSQPYAVVFNG